jgi:acyl-coenzyme A thioesterase PaaI-like protein
MSNDLHFRRLEAMYASAPVNQRFPSQISVSEGLSRISCTVSDDLFHAAGAVHGTLYFKMLDDACFYAVNSLVADVFVLTTAFNLILTKPVKSGSLTAEGRWVSGHRRIFFAEGVLRDGSGDEVGRGTGTFMRSRIALNDLDGYAKARPAG